MVLAFRCWLCDQPISKYEHTIVENVFCEDFLANDLEEIARANDWTLGGWPHTKNIPHLCLKCFCDALYTVHQARTAMKVLADKESKQGG